MSCVVVACETCKVSCCRERDRFYRSALYAWLDGRMAECADYVADLYHGVDGVLNVQRLRMAP